MSFIFVLLRLFPLEQVAAKLFNVLLDRLINKIGDKDFGKSLDTIQKVTEAAGVLAGVGSRLTEYAADGQIDDAERELIKGEFNIVKGAFEAWSKQTPTPEAFKANYR